MQIISIEVGHEPRLIEMENTLKAFQKAVGGYIETVTLERTGLVVIVNEEGKLMGLPLNGMLNIGRLIGEPLAGTVLVARTEPDGEDFAAVRACDLGLIQDCWVPFVDHRGPEMAPRRGPGRCEICGSCLAEDRVGNCCGKCHRMIRCIQCRDSRAKHPRSDVDPFDAYNGLGPTTRPRDIRYRAGQRARRAETEMNRILRRAAALGMQYGEYMIYLETQKEKCHEEQELRQHPSDGSGSHRGAGGL